MLRIILIMVLVLSTACEGLVSFDDPEVVFAGGGAEATGGTTVASALSGAELYQQNCASCHGAEGEGTPTYEDPIKGYAPIEPIVIEGRGTMPPMALATADVAKIQTFISSLAAPAEELDGQGLFNRYCASCHGADANGAEEWPSSIQGYAPIESIVLDGRGDMAAIPITMEQTAKIQVWLSTLAAPADELDGPALYQRYCSSCHGADASGAEDWPGSIQGYEPINDIVQNGRGDMEAIQITVDQTQMIQDWLLTLAPRLSSLNGPEVYDRLCVTCHGTRGEGTATKGPPIRYDDDAFSEYWTRNGRTTQEFEGDMPVYPVDMVSGAQLTEMFDWINDAPHPTDGEGLYVQYCANCHGADGGGGPSEKSIRGENEGRGKIREGEGNNYANRSSYMTGWNQNQLSDAEVDLILAYVQSL